ncbi:diaminopimelate decarboxylase [Desulfuribacillus stibiiarsenatis]|uniref:Diaminopimelate decarboxylase n=1 Tax=Desulfuribacillus stibiiarsenatis TaxID=1390249 RepID=A0A1E5L6E1_9FIRM|nr:diaminopimelate decarboxylase [Desulfuribacillus stibiiarsenatis]OEH85710.1 diaminopimelate decarboxylase [Desulfuribacillus stibiiarsenatis]
MYLHGTSKINDRGHLDIGGCDTVDLVQQFGTPLYVFDEALIRKQIQNYHQAFQECGVKYQVAYASKAFSTVAMYKLVEQENMSLEVVSEGELHTAVKADFPRDRIHFHGNNKTVSEIQYGLKENIGCFVVDNLVELELLNKVAQEMGKVAKILMRITPGVEAHTHEYIQTGQADSKFGFDLNNGQARQGVEVVQALKNLELIGFHAHIGSQIFDVRGFEMAAEKMVAWYAQVIKDFDITIRVLNLGGGFGIRYNKADAPLPVADYIKALAQAIRNDVEKFGIDMPEIWVEPGRSIVGEAGTTLYTIGTSKDIPGIRRYVAVDGGMTDNLRPAMYKAKYEAMIANKATIAAKEKVSIAGKCCESGDMLIWDIDLPEATPGDILAVSCTGAYGYSMSNNYNRIPRPAVIFVYDGQADLVVERESLDDIVKNDRIPQRFNR